MEFKFKVNRKIEVFISSSMNTEIHLNQRAVLKSFFERMPLYNCFVIEEGSNPDKVEERYIKKVISSDIIILILDKELREAVRKEYETACRNNKRIFAYISNCTHTSELQQFIDNELHKQATTSQYNNITELIDKVERDLLSDLVEKYNELYYENINLKEKLKKMKTII